MFTGSAWRSSLFMALIAGLVGWPEKRAERPTDPQP
jgi:hypothetical protein